MKTLFFRIAESKVSGYVCSMVGFSVLFAGLTFSAEWVRPIVIGFFGGMLICEGKRWHDQPYMTGYEAALKRIEEQTKNELVDAALTLAKALKTIQPKPESTPRYMSPEQS